MFDHWNRVFQRDRPQIYEAQQFLIVWNLITFLGMPMPLENGSLV